MQKAVGAIQRVVVRRNASLGTRRRGFMSAAVMEVQDRG